MDRKRDGERDRQTDMDGEKCEEAEGKTDRQMEYKRNNEHIT
jgi:hypothetical protein